MEDEHKREVINEQEEVGTGKETEVELPLTSFQKFKNVFKQTDISYRILNIQLMFFSMYLILGLIFGFSKSAGAFMVSFMILDLFLPFTKEYIGTSAWKVYFVYVPVIIFGLMINYYVHGVEVISIILMVSLVIVLIHALIRIGLFIFSKDKKSKLHNITLSAIQVIILYGLLFISVKGLIE